MVVNLEGKCILKKISNIYLCIFECANKKKNTLQFSGDDNIEETPVPIPNTEVKLYCAENTCGLPCWEDRLSPGFIFLFSSVGRALGC